MVVLFDKYVIFVCRRLHCDVFVKHWLARSVTTIRPRHQTKDRVCVVAETRGVCLQQLWTASASNLAACTATEGQLKATVRHRGASCNDRSVTLWKMNCMRVDLKVGSLL